MLCHQVTGGVGGTSNGRCITLIEQRSIPKVFGEVTISSILWGGLDNTRENKKGPFFLLLCYFQLGLRKAQQKPWIFSPECVFVHLNEHTVCIQVCQLCSYKWVHTWHFHTQLQRQGWKSPIVYLVCGFCSWSPYWKYLARKMDQQATPMYMFIFPKPIISTKPSEFSRTFYT